MTRPVPEFEVAMERADELMYAGKNSGKDRCVAGRINGTEDAAMLAAGSSP